MALHRAKTYWRHGSVACALFTGDGTFELRLIHGEVVLQREVCQDSGDAFEKSKHWHRDVLRNPTL